MRPGSDDERPIFSRFSLGEDVDRELEAHVRMRAQELEATGLTPVEAEREAIRLLGDRPTIAKACRRVVRSHRRAERRVKIVEAFMQDIRYALRGMARWPGFALVTVSTLTLGIGANTAVFSVAHGVLVDPLPFPEAEELVDVREATRSGGTMSVAWPNFVDWRTESTAFDALFAYRAGSTTVLGGERPVTAVVAAATIDLWGALGAVPLRGRLTSPSDHHEGAAPVVVVSERFWRNELAARPLDGLSLDVSGMRAAVVGVVPASFDFPVGTSIWRPLELVGPSDSRTAHNWRVVGRLADGVAVERAQEEVDALTRRVVAGVTDEDSEYLAVGAAVRPLHQRMVASAQAPLLVLLGAAGLVLLVACTNLASTMLARGSSRMREFAVRSSLGAGQARLVRQIVTESVVLAAAGSVLGVAFARALVAWLKRLQPAAVPRLAEVAVDGPVLAYTLGLAALTVVLFGLLPGVRLVRGQGLDVLKGAARGNAGRRRGTVWGWLVGGEVALALVLLVGSGLLARSLQALLTEDLGYDTRDVVSTPVTLSRVAYAEGEDHIAFYDRLLAELQAVPGIEGAGMISTMPLRGSPPDGRLEIDGDIDKRAVGEYVVVSEGTFTALDIPLVEGRTFHPSDDADVAHVAVVSESFARANWPGESAIGHTVTGGGMDDFYAERVFAEIVGVVGDVRFRPDRAPEPTVYFPYKQRPFRIRFGATVLAEAATGDGSSVAPALRTTIERVEPNVPITLATHESLMGASVASQELTATILGGFSLIALVLAVVGIYGVVSYSVSRRVREMGIRLALGAAPGGVLRMVMGGAMRSVVVGLGLGVIGALAAGRVMRGLLYGVAPGDPVAVIGAVVLLGAAALAASWVPARAGTRVDPIVTMRME